MISDFLCISFPLTIWEASQRQLLLTVTKFRLFQTQKKTAQIRGIHTQLHYTCVLLEGQDLEDLCALQ